MQKAQQRVVAAVIERGQQVLICRRPEAKQHGGLWEFPGGKIHTDEAVHDAVVRELGEELGVEATWVGELLFSTLDQRSGFEILFLQATITGEPIPIEHTALMWCERSDLLSYPLAPSDRAFATFLIGAE